MVLNIACSIMKIPEKDYVRRFKMEINRITEVHAPEGI